MSRLNEAAARVLSELEEAGEENFATLLNTVFPVKGNASEVEELSNAVAELVSKGLVNVAIENGEGQSLASLSEAESRDALDGLSAKLRFGSGKYWSWDKTFPAPYLVATKEGLVEARRLLGERGYQWWRH